MKSQSSTSPYLIYRINSCALHVAPNLLQPQGCHGRCPGVGDDDGLSGLHGRHGGVGGSAMARGERELGSQA
jgi:hypothetical protein